MAPRRPQLHDRLKAYVVAALPVLEAAFKPGAVAGIEQIEWRPAAGHTDIFQRYTQVVPLWQLLVRKTENSLHALPEYAACVDQLRSDAEISPQLDNLVGPAGSSWLLDIERLTDGTLSRVLTGTDRLSLDVDSFEKLYDDIESALLTATVRYLVTAPIGGLLCEKPSVELGGGWTVERLSDDERGRMISAGLVRPTLGDQPFVFNVPTHAVRFRYELPKTVGPQDPQQAAAQYTPVVQQLGTGLDWIAHVLRLFKPGSVFILGTTTSAENSILSIGTQFGAYSHVPLFLGPPYTLNLAEVADFESLWWALKSKGVTRTKYLDVAIRRLSYKAERLRPEDQAVDLAIAAEALFLTEGEAETRAEQGYRLAMRAAFFVESPRWTKRQLFRLMRTAYRVRNSVVHGGSPPKLKLPDGVEVDLGAFNTVVEDELRRAIKKTVGLGSRHRGHGLVIDWEGLVFGGPLA